MFLTLHNILKFMYFQREIADLEAFWPLFGIQTYIKKSVSFSSPSTYNQIFFIFKNEFVASIESLNAGCIKMIVTDRRDSGRRLRYAGTRPDLFLQSKRYSSIFYTYSMF